MGDISEAAPASAPEGTKYPKVARSKHTVYSNLVVSIGFFYSKIVTSIRFFGI